MMKYNYNPELECFEREDGLGKKIWINTVEGQRIMTLHKLGNSIAEIRNKITFNSRKVKESTVEAFIRNVKEGNIVIPMDAPLPVNISLTVEERIQNLEDEFEEFKLKFESLYCECESEKSGSFMDKIRGIFDG